MPSGGTQPIAVGVGGEHGKLGLRASQRQLLVVELDPGGEDRVLERVLARRQLGGDQAGLAGLAQAIDALALLAGRLDFLGLAQRLELRAGKEVGVAGDDLGALGHLLLADADSAPFLGPLEQIALEARLVIGGTKDGSDAHGSRNLPDWPVSIFGRSSFTTRNS